MRISWWDKARYRDFERVVGVGKGYVLVKGK